MGEPLVLAQNQLENFAHYIFSYGRLTMSLL